MGTNDHDLAALSGEPLLAARRRRDLAVLSPAVEIEGLEQRGLLGATPELAARLSCW